MVFMARRGVYEKTITVSFNSICFCISDFIWMQERKFISLLAVAYAVYSANKHVISPITNVEQDLAGIIQDIDKKEGDFTKRVSIMSDDEIAALGRGINIFLEKLQNIFRMIYLLQ